MTLEEMKMLAQCERDMYAGKVMYVVHKGQKMLVPKEVMDHFELQVGQTVSAEMVLIIIEKNMSSLREKMDSKKAILVKSQERKSK